MKKVTLESTAARPLTDREVAKLLCGVIGTCAAFGTKPDTIKRALMWILEQWGDLAPFFSADERPF
jgi:hypothetical protein